MARKIILSLFLINLSISTCQNIKPIVDFNIDRSNIVKYPWMVILSNANSITSYGSLIHQQAVLTFKLRDMTPRVVSSLRVYADCYFRGLLSLFEPERDCSVYRNVSAFHILKNYQPTYENKVAILILTKPFVLNENVGVISLNREGDSRISIFDCGILSIRSFSDALSSTATCFLLTQTVLYTVGTEPRLGTFPSQDFPTLYNDMGRESYAQYKNSEFELHFSGSPLVCKSLRQDYHLQYVHVGIVNVTYKKRLNEYNNSYYFQVTGEVVRTDNTQTDLQQLLNNIMKLN